jgi:AcrR family transcriptional regulator
MAMTSLQEIEAIKQACVQAALDDAAKHGWDAVTLETIATKAGIDLLDVKALFQNKDSILQAYGQIIDICLCETFEGVSDTDDNVRDRLFDIVIERFDILNENRAGVIAILNDLTLKPQNGLAQMLFLVGSIKHMLSLAGDDISGIKGCVKITLFTGLYLNVLRQWIKDESEDLAATMAALDKALGYYMSV